MALNTQALVTVAEMGTYYGISSSDQTTHLTFIEDTINAATEAIERYVSRQLKTRGSAITEYHSRTGKARTIFTRQYPIDAVTSIHEDPDWSWGADSLRDSGDYAINDRLDAIVVAPSAADLLQGERVIKVVYTAGYAGSSTPAVPNDIEQAALMTASWMLQQSPHQPLGRGMLGRSQQSREGDTVDSTENTSLPKPARQILDRYRRRM